MSSSYWNDLPAGPDHLPPAWREYARRQHLALIERWVGAPSGLWLKTDLFEEREATRALIPRMPSAHWIGIDISGRIAGSGAVAGGPRVLADVRRLPFRQGSFDGILSTSTLDHFDEAEDLERALRELRRVLVAHGTLLLTLDNLDNPLVRVRNALPHRLASATRLVPFQVGHTLNERDGRRALEGTGFRVERSEHLLHVPFVVGTRLARVRWYAQHVLPRWDRLADTPLARRTGHFVAFLAVACDDVVGDS